MIDACIGYSVRQRKMNQEGFNEVVTVNTNSLKWFRYLIEQKGKKWVFQALKITKAKTERDQSPANRKLHDGSWLLNIGGKCVCMWPGEKEIYIPC